MQYTPLLYYELNSSLPYLLVRFILISDYYFIFFSSPHHVYVYVRTDICITNPASKHVTVTIKNSINHLNDKSNTVKPKVVDQLLATLHG